MVCERHGWSSAAGCPYCYREADHKDDFDQWAPCSECAEKDKRIADLNKRLEKAEHERRVWEQLATERRDACLAAERWADRYRKWHEDQLAATKKAERERDAARAAVERKILPWLHW